MRRLDLTTDQANQLFKCLAQLEAGKEAAEVAQLLTGTVRKAAKASHTGLDYRLKLWKANCRLKARKKREEYLAMKNAMKECAQKLIATLTQEEQEIQCDTQGRKTRKLEDEVEEQLNNLETLRKKMRLTLAEDSYPKLEVVSQFPYHSNQRHQHTATTVASAEHSVGYSHSGSRCRIRESWFKQD